ncbi:hypothetical protein DYQ05_02060 [Treponema pedis]|nr:hypothetical protein DYQ05_02060 [Treponema pedis]
MYKRLLCRFLKFFIKWVKLFKTFLSLLIKAGIFIFGLKPIAVVILRHTIRPHFLIRNFN